MSYTMETDLSFKDSVHPKKRINYLRFLPKALRKDGLYSVLCNLLTVTLSLLGYPNLQAQIPLFYSLPDNQQLVGKQAIFILPGLATLISLVHLSLIKNFQTAHQTMLKVFMLVTLLLQLIILAILLRLIIVLH